MPPSAPNQVPCCRAFDDPSDRAVVYHVASNNILHCLHHEMQQILTYGEETTLHKADMPMLITNPYTKSRHLNSRRDKFLLPSLSGLLTCSLHYTYWTARQLTKGLKRHV